jgi:hypothetical protein
MVGTLRHRKGRRALAVLVLLTLVGVVTALAGGAGSASATVQVFSISLSNDANHDGAFSDTENVAKTATYPYTVTFQVTLNTTLGGVIRGLSDDSGNLAASPSCAALIGQTVAPGGSAQCTFDVSLASAGTTAYVDNASVTWGNGEDHASDSSTVNFPSLSLQKSSTTSLVSAVGQVVPYSYLITNTGTVTVTGISLVDNNVDSAPSCPSTTLAVGASMTCTAQHTASIADLIAGSIKNTATASSNEAADAIAMLSIPAVLPNFGGMFVVGDLTVGPINLSTGKAVTFWSAQWWKLNSLSGGTAPAAFKGFEDTPPSPTCGVNWSTDPGNSTPPPATIPGYIAIIVSSSITQSGSTISGDTQHIVIVKTDPGYEGNPGHAGTGTIVGVVC